MRHFFRHFRPAASASAALLLSCMTLSGCSLGEFAQEHVPGLEKNISPTPVQERVYMDELTGTVQHFDGTSLTLQTDDGKSYSLNLSRASIETREGIVSGSKVHVIYEGQFDASPDDTSGIKPLKVVDSLHGEEPLPDQVFQGSLVHLSDHAVTVKGRDNQDVVFPLTGADLYFGGGIRAGVPVYVHYKGEILPMPDGSGPDAGHLKVLTISDAEPFAPPAAQATPTPFLQPPGLGTPSPTGTDGSIPEVQPAVPESAAQETGVSYARISEVSDGTMTVVTQSGSGLVTLDLSSASCYARGGFAHDVLLSVKAGGSLDYADSSVVTAQSVVCEDTGAYAGKAPSATVTGVVAGSTANTVTILTSDSVRITFNREDAQNLSTGRLDNGEYIRITYDPSETESTILKAVKIEDP